MQAAPAEVELERYRVEFPTLARKVYLNSCSLGALSTRSSRLLNEFTELWTDLGASAWYHHWVGVLAELRAGFARAIGAKPSEVALSPNVSTALSTIATCLDYRQRNEVVVGELDFPTLTYQWLAKAREGVEVRFVRAQGYRQPLDGFEAALSDRTALLATSHVVFTTGHIQDIRALTELAHRRGALCLIDAYQSVGQLPVDVHRDRVDILIGGTLKWLLGGPGTAFLYVREDLIPTLSPTITGWFAHADQFAFDTRRLVYRDDAARFEFGTPSIPSAYIAKGGLEIVHEIGIERIRNRTSYLTQHLVDEALARGYRLGCPERPEERAGIVTIELADPAAVVAGLAERRIIVDHRPGVVRLSPYFYNTPAENLAVLDAIDELTGRPRA